MNFEEDKICPACQKGNFKMNLLKKFVNNMALHKFSTTRTPQQNRVIERKNISLEELIRTMLNESNIPKYFWTDVISIACYVLNSDEGVTTTTTSLEAPSRRITRSISRGESSIPSSLSLFCISLV